MEKKEQRTAEQLEWDAFIEYLLDELQKGGYI